MRFMGCCGYEEETPRKYLSEDSNLSAMISALNNARLHGQYYLTNQPKQNNGGDEIQQTTLYRRGILGYPQTVVCIEQVSSSDGRAITHFYVPNSRRLPRQTLQRVINGHPQVSISLNRTNSSFS